MQTHLICWDSLPQSLFLNKPSLSDWLSLGMELSNLNVNLEGTPLVTGGNACLLEDTKIRVVMRWQRSFSLSQDNKCQKQESGLEHFM